MNQGLLQYSIWLAATIFQALVLVAMVRRKVHKEFPMFYWYTIAHLVDSVGSFIATQFPGDTYFYVYWGWEAFDAILTLIVIQSVFLKIFDLYTSLRELGVTVFRWAVVGFCLFALVTAILAPGSGDRQLMKGALVMESSIQLVQVGLLLCLFLFSRLFGLAWRHYIYGIILGFGISATLSLVAAALKTKVGPNYHHYFSWVLSASYSCAIVTWLCYLTAHAPVEVSAKPPNSIQLREWNEALACILRK